MKSLSPPVPFVPCFLLSFVKFYIRIISDVIDLISTSSPTLFPRFNTILY